MGAQYGPGINPPPPSSQWVDTISTFTGSQRLLHRREGTGLNARSRAGSGTNPSNKLAFQGTSIPMEEQTISGTVKGIFYGYEPNDTDEYMPQLVARVVSYDGQVVRGTLYDAENQAITNEFNVATRQNRKFPRNWAGSGDTLTPVTALVGDRLVLEIGYRQASTSVASAVLSFGETLTALDAAEDETTTHGDNDENCWIEFSYDFRWYPILAGRRAGTRF